MQRYNKFLIYANFGGGFVKKKNEFEQEEKENASRKKEKNEREQDEKEREIKGRKKEREQEERTRAGRNMPRDVFRMQASKAICVHKIIE